MAKLLLLIVPRRSFACFIGKVNGNTAIAEVHRARERRNADLLPYARSQPLVSPSPSRQHGRRHVSQDRHRDGRLKSTDGVYGIRFAHNTDATVTGLSMTK